MGLMSLKVLEVMRYKKVHQHKAHTFIEDHISPSPVGQWLTSSSIIQQGVGSNLAQITKDFSLTGRGLLSPLSNGMGVCDV